MINTTRRIVLTMLGGLVVAPLARGWSYMSGNLEVVLSVSDEQGKPISYATVWGYVLPRADALALGGEDLWRVTTRYQSSFEFAMPFNRVVRTLQVMPMSDASGRAKSVIDYQRLEGSDSRRPNLMQIGFAVMKRGYLPVRIDFDVKDGSRLTGKIVLKRDPSQSLETQPYLQEFERIRYELSDISRNENISGITYERAETLRKALEVATAQAIEAGDKAAAARIYARMQYLPMIKMHNGKAVGFAQAEPYAEQSWGYLVKAYQLNSGNSYIAAEYLFRYGANEFGGHKYVPEQASVERKQAFAAFMLKLHALMQASGPRIWPEYHKLYARWHRKSSDAKERARMLPLLEELYRLEPKLETKEQLLQVPLA